MTEKELLAYAAKAAGISWHTYDTWSALNSFKGLNINGPMNLTEGTTWWNPHTNDGDAFRLLVRLGLDLKVDLPNRHASVHHHSSGVLIDIKLSGDLTDSTAAVREAIFQVAVAIGKAMP